MDMDTFNEVAGWAIYGAQGWTALYGLYCVILLFRQIRLKQFSSPARAADFSAQVHELMQQRQFDKVAELCDSPPYWSKVVPQLILFGLTSGESDPAKVRRLLAEKFERDVLADFEYRMAWISTVVKTAPMLGLLGTVQGMIGAFAKIAATTKETGTDPTQLAGDISFALLTTAIGLMVAIPLVMISAMIHVRIGKLQDGVQQGLGAFLADLDAANARTRRGTAP